MGPPGVGKGTQADCIKNELMILHLSTGEILRAEVDAKSVIGRNAKLYMDFGRLVPDNILIEIVTERISKSDCQNGYILDGFPRTLPQAKGLDEMMHSIGHDLDCAISLTANKDEKDIVYITIAGRSNALSGFVAANCEFPTIGCPPFSDKTDMLVNVHSTLQMPSNTPVLTILDPGNCALAVKRIFGV